MTTVAPNDSNDPDGILLIGEVTVPTAQPQPACTGHTVWSTVHHPGVQASIEKAMKALDEQEHQEQLARERTLLRGIAGEEDVALPPGRERPRL